jgi:hypothetical protein
LNHEWSESRACLVWVAVWSRDRLILKSNLICLACIAIRGNLFLSKKKNKSSSHAQPTHFGNGAKTKHAIRVSLGELLTFSFLSLYWPQPQHAFLAWAVCMVDLKCMLPMHVTIFDAWCILHFWSHVVSSQKILLSSAHGVLVSHREQMHTGLSTIYFACFSNLQSKMDIDLHIRLESDFYPAVHLSMQNAYTCPYAWCAGLNLMSRHNWSSCS